MSVEFIAGKPGNGKSLLAVKQLVETLRATAETYISTNLALDMPRLCEYLHQKYGETFNASQRIRILDEVECSEFWLYPYPNVNLDARRRIKIVTRGTMTKDVVDIASQRLELGNLAPVTYMIDEVHQFFNAREWATTGTDCIHYLSQHRKLGDDVIAISQAVENVDKQFQRVAQCFHYVKNLSKIPIPIFGGLIKAPPLFVRSEYLNPYTGNQTAVRTQTFTLDAKGIASCYRTAAGVGLVGRHADVGSPKRSGLPWWVIPIGIVAVVAIMYYIPKLFFNKAINIGKGEPAGVPVQQLRPVQRSEPQSVPSTNTVHVAPSEQVFYESTEVFWSSRYKVNGQWRIVLSDGRIFIPPDPRIRALSDNAVMIGTNIYKWGRPASKTDGKARSEYSIKHAN